MTALTRDAIFISHANPEDNDFTVWLGARLTAAGYEVWADVLRLRGGQDWQRLLEDALRNKACKVLLVGTEHGVRKQGVRNEIQIAHTVGRSIADAEFVIPLRLTNFDAPFLVVHAQYIDFKRSWADGHLDHQLRNAAEFGDVAAIDTLIDAGVDPNACNSADNTALHHAAWRGHASAIEALLGAGVDHRARNAYGATPLDIAVRERLRETAGVLGHSNAGAVPVPIGWARP